MVENGEPDNNQTTSKWKVKCVLKEPGKKTKGLKTRKQGEKKRRCETKWKNWERRKEKSSKDKNKQWK